MFLSLDNTQIGVPSDNKLTQIDIIFPHTVDETLDSLSSMMSIDKFHEPYIQED